MRHLLVVGDVLLDRDLVGTAERLSPSAPVPVIDEELIIDRAGGAGLAALIARAHGAEVTLVCAFAADEGARVLRELLVQGRVGVVDCVDDGQTVEKIRVRARDQSLVRIDRGKHGCIGGVPAAAHEALERSDALLIADYGNGIAARDDVRELVRRAIDDGIPTVWDPHPRGATPVCGTTVVTPNVDEAAVFDPLQTPAHCALAAQVARARRLGELWDVPAVCVTRGTDGALLTVGDNTPLVVPVDEPVRSVDACGAGDAFAAAVAVALAAGSIVSEAIETAVAAASAFISAGGAGAMSDSRAESAAPVETSTERAPRSATMGFSSGTTVAAGGCFDVLHPGHIVTLERARRLGDRLVVLLNSDASVRRLKGPSRPVQSQAARAAVLRSLRCVDDVVVFEEDTPIDALRRLRPDVFVKGGDYAMSAGLPEVEVMADHGGAVVTVPYLTGHSTSGILHRVDPPKELHAI